MAERRMFAKTIIDSDAFLDMPLSTQALYFHLGMRADDDGFVNNPKKIQRMVGCSDDDGRILIAKKFIIPFESGVVVIKHWKIHNYIQKDRYHETKYEEEKSRLAVKENGAYTMISEDVIDLDTKCIQDVSKMDTQVRLGKDRDRDRLDNNGASAPKRIDYSEEFNKFWELYPRNDVKSEAYKNFNTRVKEGIPPERLIEAARNYAEACKKDHREKKFILQAKTFLGPNLRFEDYLPKEENKSPEQYDNPFDYYFDKFKDEQ